MMNVDDLKATLSEWGPITVVLLVLTVAAAAVGGVIVITHPETLSFDQYLSKMEGFSVALAGLGVAHGVKKGLERQNFTPEHAVVAAGAAGGVNPDEDMGADEPS